MHGKWYLALFREVSSFQRLESGTWPCLGRCPHFRGWKVVLGPV